MIWIQAIAAGAVCGAILYDVIKSHKKKPICDSCKNLLRKGGGLWEYYCYAPMCVGRVNKFDYPPEYCSRYEKREDCEQ